MIRFRHAFLKMIEFIYYLFSGQRAIDIAQAKFNKAVINQAVSIEFDRLEKRIKKMAMQALDELEVEDISRLIQSNKHLSEIQKVSMLTAMNESSKPFRPAYFG